MEHIIQNMFPPHSECWLWRWDIILLHVIGDGLTALAYYIIPCVLYYLTKKYVFDFRLKSILWIYSIFILLCGTTHLFDVMMVWYINETVLLLDGWLRVLTGIFSIFSAIVTFYSVWRFLGLAKDFFGITTQMAKERERYDRVELTTWTKFEESVNGMKEALANVED